ncbi:MAG: hypothetical protein MPK62_11145, partial [Alphaproteobacteria bacterium]|nr:hypothetical protein [Alphaproteobacteria bacterium]
MCIRDSIQTDQPTSGYNLPQSNVSFNIISVLSTNSNFQIQGTLNFIIPSSLAGIASGNLDEVFSHTQATPYIEVGSGKTVPASDQWGAYRLTLRFGSGVERTVYVKIRD